MFRETWIGAGGVLEARLHDDLTYSLCFKRGKRILVEYSSSRAYEFKSVEKLRYDFERDVEKALRQG